MSSDLGNEQSKELPPFSSYVQTHPTLVILYPQSIDSYRACAYIIIMKELVGHNILIMTKNKNLVNAALPSNLDDQFYCDYDDSEKYARFVNYHIESQYNYLIVDDLSMYATMEIKIRNPSPTQKTRILFLGTLGIRSPDIEYLENQYTLSYLSFGLYDSGPSLKYMVHSNQGDKVKKIAISLLIRRYQIHLVSFQNSEKMNQLEEILSDWKYPYQIIEPSDLQDPDFEVRSFRNGGAFLMTVSPPSHISNVSEIHFFDVPNYYQYRSFIDRFYRISSITKPIGQISVHFYLHLQNSDSEKKSIDLSRYQNIYDILLQEETQMNLCLKRSCRLEYRNQQINVSLY